MAKEILHRLEITQDSRLLSPLETWLRRKLKCHSLGLASLESTMARTKSRLRWLKEGDANTVYFQQHARYRKKKNFISKLQVDDRLILDQEEKKEAVWGFYNELLGTARQRDFTLDLLAFHRPASNLSDLELLLSDEEIWATINVLPLDKARARWLYWSFLQSGLVSNQGGFHGCCGLSHARRC